MKLLDLFCGGGGAAEGYRRAGFTIIVGVDIAPQKRYPFEFVQADAMTYPLDGFDAIHASPPCQRYSSMTKKWARQDQHPDLVAPMRARLEDADPPLGYVIENVPAAPLVSPVMLCGSMFGLGAFVCGCGTTVPQEAGMYGCANCNGDEAEAGRTYQLQRHRIFETTTEIFAPATCAHVGQPLPVYGHAGGRSKRDGLKFPGTDAWRAGMDIDWMTGKELAEAIPPAFTEYIGKHLIRGARV